MFGHKGHKIETRRDFRCGLYEQGEPLGLASSFKSIMDKRVKEAREDKKNGIKTL